MNNYRKKFSKEELSRELHKNDKMAYEIIEDEKKWQSFQKKFNDFLFKAETIPVLGGVIDDLITMVDLVDAYIKKEYRGIPVGTVISIVAGLIYVLSPIDLIPDAIPVIGFVDDAAVIMFVLKLGVDKDLDKFRVWKNRKLEECISEINNSFAEILHDTIGTNYLAAVVLMCDNSLKLLISKEKCEDEMICKIKVLQIPTNILNEFEINDVVEIKKFIDVTLSNEIIHWIDGAEKVAIYEPDFELFWDNYIIEED